MPGSEAVVQSTNYDVRLVARPVSARIRRVGSDASLLNWRRINESRLASIIILLLIGILYILPRLVGLDQFVTSDEPIWLGRSANFYRALVSGEFWYTFQFAHPGVLTMWSGLVGYLWAAPDYPNQFTDNLRATFEIHLRLRELGVDELDVLIAARISKIVVQTLLFLISMHFVRQLFGVPVMIIAGVLIAFDPFLSGHDSLLHVDGLFAIASFAAILALAKAVQYDNRSVFPWIAAGSLAALAWLTRSTGIVIVVILVGALLIQALGRFRVGMPLRQALERPALSGVLWAVGALVTTVVLWPALWVDPAGVFTEMWNWASDAASEGHGLPTFFAGTIHEGDPGLWFYPVTLVWRLTPISILGIMLFAVAAFRRRLPDGAVPVVLILASFATLYVIGMSLGAKKFDRYILPVYPILDLFAATGLIFAFRSLRAASIFPRNISRIALSVAVVAVVSVQIFATLSVLPYRLDYYNPLLGGPDAAEHELQIGWGQGMDEVADIIIADARPADLPADQVAPPLPEIDVRISGARAPLLYLLPHSFTVYPSHQPPDTLERWNATDYYVAYIQRWQRELDDEVISYLEQFEPLGVVEVEGVEFARVYKLADIPPLPAVQYESRTGGAMGP